MKSCYCISGLCALSLVTKAVSLHAAPHTIRFNGAVPPAISSQQNVAQDQLVRCGYLDVTRYGADPSGKRDSTAQIQKTVDDASEYGYIVFFPQGTYLVSDTISCKMTATGNRVKTTRAGSEKLLPQIETAHVLEGSTRGPRPVIRLKDRCAGFADAGKPKLVIDIWQQFESGYTPFKDRHGQSSGFNQTFRNINIDLGTGNAGAIGIYINAAQSAALEDVEIRAYGAYAGVYDLPGRSMGAVNLTVLGGRYGIILQRQNISIMAGIRLIDQESAALQILSANAPQTLVGFSIEKDEAPAITFASGGNTTDNNLLMYDGSILIRNSRGENPVIDNAAGRTFYMRNVYVKGSEKIIRYKNTTTVQGKADAWTLIREYATCAASGNPQHFSLINGKAAQDEVIDIGDGAGSPPASLIERHVWKRFPHFEDPDAKNVKDSDIGAKGDGKTDDAGAIQKAIDAHEKVYLPSGIYMISRTLRMKKNTKLFGASCKTISLMQHPSWKPEQEAYMIETEDSADGDACLANIIFQTESANLQYDYCSIIHWRVGRNSMVKLVAWDPIKLVSRKDADNEAGNGIRHIRISGNGGGRWYMIDAIRGYGARSLHPDQRLVSIENTREPLTFYGHDIETCKSECQTEITGSKNVRIFAVKIEGDWPVMRIVNSENIFVGATYARNTFDGQSLFSFIDSDNITGVMLSGAADSGVSDKAFVVTERFGGEVISQDQRKSCALYKRGQFNDAIFIRE